VPATGVACAALVRTAIVALVPARLLWSCIICMQSRVMAASAVFVSIRAVACLSSRF